MSRAPGLINCWIPHEILSARGIFDQISIIVQQIALFAQKVEPISTTLQIIDWNYAKLDSFWQTSDWYFIELRNEIVWI